MTDNFAGGGEGEKKEKETSCGRLLFVCL